MNTAIGRQTYWATTVVGITVFVICLLYPIFAYGQTITGSDIIHAFGYNMKLLGLVATVMGICLIGIIFLGLYYRK